MACLCHSSHDAAPRLCMISAPRHREETAETTTWRSPSGGKWIFESKPLVVTSQMKSEHIYFEGEKSVALEEQIKTYMERSKLAMQWK